MNKEQLWGFLIQHNPRLVEDPHFTPDSIRRFFDITWNAAYHAASRDWNQREREISGADEEEQEFLEMMSVLAGMAEDIKKKLADDQKKKNKE